MKYSEAANELKELRKGLVGLEESQDMMGSSKKEEDLKIRGKIQKLLQNFKVGDTAILTLNLFSNQLSANCLSGIEETIPRCCSRKRTRPS